MAVTEVLAPPSEVATGPLSVAVRDLSVRFLAYSEARISMRQLVGRGFRNRQATHVDAVRHASFDIRSGEAVGIVGQNGSGKSTLLRALAGLQPPTTGTVMVSHRPYLLGVRAALQGDLSGYRNIYLGGLAMGMRINEIRDAIDEVVEFADLHDAIDRPLKTYSSGMRARLAFSIATLRVPEILLIDEALAVGDRHFRNKSLERINRIRDRAHTIVMVTHNVNEIRKSCSRCMWIDDGTIKADGDVEEVLALYAGPDEDADDD